ncbi:MAG TPA: CocE/NonD family hydrolase, partial [Candidatus Thermoplasmatota archaeon]|nr:CocE/NonD family hydrolase [Candidatus Thermoplasmatota archaeon]
QPWSNGRVGMFGKSYDGETQQSTATLAPPHLVTIVPVSSVAGQYDYSYYDGVPYTLQTMLSNVFYAQGDGLQPATGAQAQAHFPERVGCHAAHFAQGFDDSGDWSPYWEEREFRKRAENVTASVLYVHGLQDWNVKPSNVRDWFENLDVPKMALLGQWAHDYPEANNVHGNWSRHDWQELVWRWYDHWLLGRDTGVEELLGQVQIQDTSGRWRVERAFPPASTPRAFFLAGDALADAPADAPARSYAEPLVPNPFETIGPLPRAGVAYESAALPATLHWSGWPTLALNASLDKPDAHFAVHLLDVAPDGSAQWVARGYLSARHRDGVEAPSDVPTGSDISYQIRFFPGDVVVEAGHRLRLSIMPADDWASGAGNGATVAISGGVLTLPLVDPPAEAFFEPPTGDPITEPVT